MPYYRSVGEVPRKRHTQFRAPDGGLYAEELMGNEGFSPDSSLLYHRHPPTAIVDAAEVSDARPAPDRPNLPLKPAPPAAPTSSDAAGADPVPGRQCLLGQRRRAGSRTSLADRPSAAVPQRHRRRVPLRRVRRGAARVVVRRARRARAGDYVVIPTSTIHRVVPQRRRAAAAAA